jgi:hypothetical protein
MNFEGKCISKRDEQAHTETNQQNLNRVQPPPNISLVIGT